MLANGSNNLVANQAPLGSSAGLLLHLVSEGLARTSLTPCNSRPGATRSTSQMHILQAPFVALAPSEAACPSLPASVGTLQASRGDAQHGWLTSLRACLSARTTPKAWSSCCELLRHSHAMPSCAHVSTAKPALPASPDSSELNGNVDVTVT